MRILLAWLLSVVFFAALANENQSPEPERLPLAVAGCASMGSKCVCRNEVGAVVPPVPSMCRMGTPINLGAFFPLAVAPVAVVADLPRFPVPPVRVREVTRLGRFLLE